MRDNYFNLEARRLGALVVMLGAIAAGSAARAAEYQWSAVVEGVTARGNEHPRAFLWVPPDCQQVKAVVVGQHNMLEEDILENVAFRKTMAELGVAIVWISPSMDARFFNPESMNRFNALMKALAGVSGYTELETAPVIPLGHSAHASFPWNFAALAPQRTLAILSVHGDAPETPMAGFGGGNPDWGDKNIDGIPGLMVMGEWEWVEDRLTPAFAYKLAHPKACIAVLAEPGQGHFDACDELIQFLAMFIKKSMAARLPNGEAAAGQPPALRAVDPASGWLVDRWTYNQGRSVKPAPVGQYLGDATGAFWAFDEEMANATQNYFVDQNGKKPQLIGFVQDGKVVPATTALEMIKLKFEPEEDGVTFKLKATFLDTVTSMGAANDTVAKNNHMRWTREAAGTPLGHAMEGGPIRFSRIEGPVQQVDADTFRISFYRANAASQRTIWLYASHPGDKQFKSAVQQANMAVPVNATGTEQHITFPEIPNQKKGAASVTLGATSDSQLPVYYYVREGPAEVEGNTLKLLGIPPRSKLPVKVTVVAWQLGRGAEPKVRAAEMVERTFLIE